jgi:hypothetical protein
LLADLFGEAEAKARAKELFLHFVSALVFSSGPTNSLLCPAIGIGLVEKYPAIR